MSYVDKGDPNDDMRCHLNYFSIYKLNYDLQDQNVNEPEFEISKVLYMSFDKFLLAVESRDLSQADKNII